uniref:Uncharacterized protein n=1 Tax=Rhodnius prolixus TaxID=13249 RepID=T1IEJ3_RHOPR
MAVSSAYVQSSVEGCTELSYLRGLLMRNVLGSCSNWPPPLEMHRHALSCQLPLTVKEIDSALTDLQLEYPVVQDLTNLMEQQKMDEMLISGRNMQRLIKNGKDESILHPISFVYSLRDTHLIGPTIQDILVSTDGLAVQHMMQQIPL